MLTCIALPMSDIPEDGPLRRTIRNELTRPGSDFHDAVLTKTDGHIAVVWEDEVPVGWARTEVWRDGQGVSRDTLEAFVSPERRLLGIAALAASSLYSEALRGNGDAVAVFHPHMLLVARRVGLFPTLFMKRHGEWVRA